MNEKYANHQTTKWYSVDKFVCDYSKDDNDLVVQVEFFDPVVTQKRTFCTKVYVNSYLYPTKIKLVYPLGSITLGINSSYPKILYVQKIITLLFNKHRDFL